MRWTGIIMLLALGVAGMRVEAGQADTGAVVMRFAGDVLLGAHYERAAAHDPGMAFHGFDLFRTADIAVVNLENPVTTRGKKVPKPFNFRMQPRFLSALTGAGIGVVSIANNHVYDYGEEGLFDTFLYLDSARISYIGGGRTKAEAHRPYLFGPPGLRTAIFAYYGGGEARAATARQGGVARRDLGLILQDVRTLRAQEPDITIVVILHWGTEKAQVPDRAQQSFARALIDGGVHAVVGHHPHVLQGIERYRNGIIVYSLGNFLFGGNSRDTYDTGVFEMVLYRSGPSYRFIPVGVRDWRLKVLEGADAERVIAHVRSLSRSFPSSIFTH